MKKWLNKKQKVLRQYITIFRFWVLKKMFSEDEKYLIVLAIEDRIYNLERIAVTERWADEYNIKTDLEYYLKIIKIFSTKDYG